MPDLGTFLCAQIWPLHLFSTNICLHVCSALLFSSITEMLVISYVYGIENFCMDIKLMINRDVGKFWRVCWQFVSPALLSVNPLTHRTDFSNSIFLECTCGYIGNVENERIGRTAISLMDEWSRRSFDKRFVSLYPRIGCSSRAQKRKHTGNNSQTSVLV